MLYYSLLGYLLLIFLSSFLSSVLLTYIVRKYSPMLGFVDMPGARKVHKKPIPNSGGIAILFSYLLSNLLFQDHYLIRMVITGAVLIALLGFLDDRLRLRPLYKFLGQLFIAILTVFVFKIHFNISNIYFLNNIISVFWIVGITNSFNLLDNMDGLSVGVAIIALSFFLYFALQSFNIFSIFMIIALLGSCLGFLGYNFKPASIFMGDMGSMTLGYLLSVFAMLLTVNLKVTDFNYYFVFLISLLILGVPILDTTVVTFSRLLKGKKITDGGKDHLSHRIVFFIKNEMLAVLILYLLAISFGLLAIVFHVFDLKIAIIASGVFLITIFFSMKKIFFLNIYGDQKQ